MQRMNGFPIVELTGPAFERGLLSICRKPDAALPPDVPSRTEYRRVALAGEPALA